MPGKHRAHYAGNYQTEAANLVAAANNLPDTRCWRCGRTLAEHPPHRNGTPARWTAGHRNDGQIGGPLAPEASTCNYSAGAQLAHQRRKNTRTTITW